MGVFGELGMVAGAYTVGAGSGLSLTEHTASLPGLESPVSL